MIYKFLILSQFFFGFYQDGKLLLMEDNAGNKPPTFDVVARATYGHRLAFIGEWEFAHLHGGLYGRMSAGLQYNIPIDFATLSVSAQAGQIERVMSNRDGKYPTYILNADAHIKASAISKQLTDKVEFGLLNNFTKRTDLHDNRMVWSLMAGIRIKI